MVTEGVALPFGAWVSHMDMMVLTRWEKLQQGLNEILGTQSLVGKSSQSLQKPIIFTGVVESVSLCQTLS